MTEQPLGRFRFTDLDGTTGGVIDADVSFLTDAPPPVEPPVEPPFDPPVEPPVDGLPAFARLHTDPTRRNDEWFVGCRLPESELEHVRTLIIDQPRLYDQFACDRILFTTAGRGATLRDVHGTSNSPYIADFTNGWTFGGYTDPEDLTLEHVTMNQTGLGKTILGTGFNTAFVHVIGGEDGVHRNQPGSSHMFRTITEEQNIDGQSHSDAIQNTSGGAVGPATVHQSILQSNVAGAGFQNNVSSGTNRITETLFHGGGHYFINGDKGNVETEDCFFAWGSLFHHDNDAKWLPAAVGSHDNPMWWSRQHRPRLFGGGGYHTATGEAPGFPGNGTLIR
jgi:hypothetical protein